MQGWAIAARALAGASAIMLAAAAPAQDAAIPRADGYAELERLPDWSGVWNPDWSLLFAAGGGRQAQAQPKFTPDAQAKLDAFRKRQEEEGVSQDAQIRCIPPGMPGIMRQPYPIEFIFSPGRVTMFAETYSQARRIYTDGRALPDDPDFLFNGTSIGRWDGDALIVETVGFSPLINYVAGVPHGDKMHIEERIWLEKPDVMRIVMTITDPGVLTEPYVQQIAYKKEPTWEIREYVCEENNRLSADEGGANLDLDFDPDDPFGPPPE
jgi:hypothetical protein